MGDATFVYQMESVCWNTKHSVAGQRICSTKTQVSKLLCKLLHSTIITVSVLPNNLENK
jgi:hypothetical protein